MNTQTNEVAQNALPRDDDFYFMRRMLLILTSAGMIGVSGLIVASYFMGSTPGILTSIVAFMVVAAMWWFTKNNHLLVPRIVGPLFAFSAVFFVTLNSNGLHDRGMCDFFMVLLLAGLLLGRVGIVIFGIITVLVINGIAYAEVNGILVNKFSAYTTMTDAAILSVFLALSGIIYYMTIDNLTRSLQRQRHSEASLAANNRELETIRAGLAEQVVERTRNLEAARQDAETANQALQAQMWQLSGLSQLNDVMRGEPDLAALSANVMQHLCRYVEAVIGALYLLDADTLRQTGSYAYPMSPATPVTFKLGESLVGQAARDQGLLQLDAVPDGYLTVTSALGETAPRHLVILPFLFEGRVIGVVEIGKLTRFTPAQMNFLGAAMQNVAVAFNSAQARSRIHTLRIAAPSRSLD